MDNPFGLAGKVVMVTGGASGIGRACISALTAAGASVAVVDINAEGAEAVAEEIRQAGGKAFATGLDVRDYDATEQAADAVESALGPIDGLIAAAGIARAMPAAKMRPEHWEPIINVNLTGLFYTVQVVGSRMVERGSGSIVTFGSTSSIAGQPARAAYCAAKAGVVGLTRDLAVEWGSYSVRVNAIGPSLTDTPMVRNGIPPRFITDVVEDRTPLGRMGQPEEMANVCLFLLSDLSSYLTGTLIMADGGLSAGLFAHKQGRDLSSKALIEAGFYTE